MSEERCVRVNLVGPTAMLLVVIGAAGGYLAAGLKGLAAGLLAMGSALLFAILGVIPVAGPLLYWLAMSHVEAFIHAAGVDLGVVWAIAYWTGALASTMLTVLSALAILVFLTDLL